jgi:hypothetical protein
MTKKYCLQRRYIVLPSDCGGIESKKTIVLYIRRGGQKVNTMMTWKILYGEQ